MRTFYAKGGCWTKIITLQSYLLSPITCHVPACATGPSVTCRSRACCIWSADVLTFVSRISQNQEHVKHLLTSPHDVVTCLLYGFWYYQHKKWSEVTAVRTAGLTSRRGSERQYRVFCAGKNWNVTRFLLLQFVANYYKLLKRWFALKFILPDQLEFPNVASTSILLL